MYTLKEWRAKNSMPAGYSHFDQKVGLGSRFVWRYVTDCKKIARHGFYPFIYYEKKILKCYKEEGKITLKEKVRPICYASHIDRCIYKYYGFLLNDKYNEYAVNNGIDDYVLAYRTNKEKNNNNNIYFAKKAIDFIKKADCHIIVGDFTSFFDNLDHNYLKRMLKKVLNVEGLDDDWYAIFKNITKYSTWDLLDLLKLNDLRDTRADMKKFNLQNLSISKEQFKSLKGKYIKRNLDKGIPQGSPISSILSNVYMIDFDKEVCSYINEKNGLYLRYSDDFIIIVPNSKYTDFKEIVEYIYNLTISTDGLDLERKKTQVYSFKNSSITNCTDKYIEGVENGKNFIDYLGFTFNGNFVTLRPKTIFKYYSRMYRKLKYIIKCREISKYGKKISYKNLYKTYTQKGRNIIHNANNFNAKGNFLTYVYKAEKIFGKNEKITSSTKRHMLKIRRKRDEVKNVNKKL